MEDDTTHTHDLEEQSIARSRLYLLFNRAFRYPSEPGEGPQAMEEAHKWAEMLGMPSSPDVITRLADALTDIPLSRLQAEYVRLFDYRPVCPAQESAYVKDTSPQVLIGQLLRLYGSAGVTCSTDLPPDHLAVECEFMHYMCFKESAQTGADEALRWRALQGEFLRAHALEWIPTFSERLASEGTSPYGLLGTLLYEFLDAERQRDYSL